MSHIKVGVVGFGYWGPNLVRNFVDLPDTEVVAVADLRPERLKVIHSTYPAIQTTQNYSDLKDMNLDAIVIATPPKTHYPIAKEFLDHGVSVLVEKPMTLHSQDCQELCELAEKKNLTLMVGHTFEFNGAVLALKQVINSGEIGKIYYIDTARLNLGLYQNGLNVLWDLAPHDISILTYLLESDPISISAKGSSFISNGIEDVVYLTMRFPNDILAHVHVSWLDPCKVRRVTVVGSKKMVVYNDIEASEKLKIYDKGVEPMAYTNSFSEFIYNYRYGDITIPNIRFSEPLRVECQHFVNCVANHEKPRSCGEDGMRGVRILEAAQKSLRERSEVEV